MRDHHVGKTKNGGYSITMYFNTWEEVTLWQAEQFDPWDGDVTYIPWQTGKNPFADNKNARVRVMTENRGSFECLASKVDWSNLGPERIIGYYLIEGDCDKWCSYLPPFSRNTGYANPFVNTDPEIIVILKNKNVRVIKASLVDWRKPNGDDEVMAYCEYAKS